MGRAEEVRVVEKQLVETVTAGDWEAASAAHTRMKSLKPDHPLLVATWSKIGPELQKLEEGRAEEQRRVDAANAEEERRKNVSLGLRQARSVVTDEKLCDTPKAIADAWELVKQVRREDPEWSAAVAVTPRLESCRRSVEQALSRGLQKIMIGQREQWAKNAEKKMLDEGMDVEFGLDGAAKDQLTVKWALMGKVAVHKITRDGSMRDGAFLAQMQKIGFERVSFSNGWNFYVYYTLNPSDETNIGKGVWEGMGVREPLALR
jgi:hypothetical protein